MSVGTETRTGARARRRAGDPGLAGRARPGRVPSGSPGAGRPGVPGRAAPPDRRARPGRPPRSAPRRTAPGRPAGAAEPSAPIARTPFILLVVGLLGGGLICLLLINTILASGAYQITTLQQAQAAREQQVQALQQQVATDSAPSVIASRARQLGMAAPPLTSFLNLQTGRINSQPMTEPGVPAVPGYVP